MSLEARLAQVRARIADAERAAGRPAGSVTLVAASKTRSVDEVRAALALGQRDFGENYAQELRDKADALGLAPTWHFIGRLQRNKAKYVAGRASLVHDVDSVELAREIGVRSGVRTTAILLGVNIGAEPQKSGVLPDGTLALAREVLAVPGVRLAGLMCLPPADAEPAPHFAHLASLAAEGRAEGLPLDLLSMGMSDDLEAAIAAGATHVRVGTAIFGPRG
jgi:pyridoxal phosphate enzyme (YggS family)